MGALTQYLFEVLHVKVQNLYKTRVHNIFDALDRNARLLTVNQGKDNLKGSSDYLCNVGRHNQLSATSLSRLKNS
jgi:hypothetical protein